MMMHAAIDVELYNCGRWKTKPGKLTRRRKGKHNERFGATY
jgi:hypothetical protein